MTDSRGVTHEAFSWCACGEFSTTFSPGERIRGIPLNVGDVPVDCMECVANPAEGEGEPEDPW